jgi:hypothetical protein
MTESIARRHAIDPFRRYFILATLLLGLSIVDAPSVQAQATFEDLVYSPVIESDMLGAIFRRGYARQQEIYKVGDRLLWRIWQEVDRRDSVDVRRLETFGERMAGRPLPMFTDAILALVDVPMKSGRRAQRELLLRRYRLDSSHVDRAALDSAFALADILDARRPDEFYLVADGHRDPVIVAMVAVKRDEYTGDPRIVGDWSGESLPDAVGSGGLLSNEDIAWAMERRERGNSRSDSRIPLLVIWDETIELELEIETEMEAERPRCSGCEPGDDSGSCDGEE